MRITIEFQDKIVEEAKHLTGIHNTTVLIHEGLRALIERESTRRLSRLAGSQPDLKDISKRR
jgi:hypothetical protein